MPSSEASRRSSSRQNFLRWFFQRDHVSEKGQWQGYICFGCQLMGSVITESSGNCSSACQQLCGLGQSLVPSKSRIHI